jgi:DNA polymerase III sliding clamp (beta) subunit (PCNA family)
MEINKLDLQTALDAIKPGVSAKEIIEHSDSFAFLNGYVFSYNDEISMGHPIPGLDITGVVKAEELHQLLRKVKQSVLSVEITEGEFLVRFGKGSAGLCLVRESSLPLDEVSSIKEYLPITSDFIDALNFVLPTCSRDMTLPMLTCVHIRSDGWMEATDNQKIARHRYSRIDIDSVLVPAHICPYISKLQPVGIQQTRGWLHFINKEGTTLSCRIFEQGFPPDAKVQSSLVLEDGVDIILPKRVIELIDRASVFGSRKHFLDDEVTLRFARRVLIVSAKNDSGWFEEECPIRYTGNDLEVSLSPNFMASILLKSAKCTVTADKIGFGGDDWVFVSTVHYVKTS